MPGARKESEAMLEELLEDLKIRMSLPELRAILKEEDLPKAIGWKQLAEKISESTPDIVIKAARILGTLQGDTRVAGTRQAYIYQLPKEEIRSFRSEFNAAEVSPNAYSTAFPKTLRETQLKKQDAEYHLAAKIEKTNGDVSLVFCSKRSQEERLTYQMREVGEAVQLAFDGYDHFIAIRTFDYQIFDVINLRPSLERVEILIDQPQLIRSPNTADSRMLGVLGFASNSLPCLIPLYEANAPMNLYACISGLYHSKTQGRVSRLSCRLPTGPVVKESMNTSDDMRNETFHSAGVTAVDQIKPFDITVVWDSMINVSGRVEVQVGTGVLSLGTENPLVTSARLNSIRSDNGIIAAINKLVSHSQ